MEKLWFISQDERDLFPGWLDYGDHGIALWHRKERSSFRVELIRITASRLHDSGARNGSFIWTGCLSFDYDYKDDGG